MSPVIVTGNSAQQAQRREQLRKEKVQKSTIVTVLSDDCFVTKSKMTTDEAIIIKQWILDDANRIIGYSKNEQITQTQAYQQEQTIRQQQIIANQQFIKGVLSSPYFYVVVVFVIIGWFFFKGNEN